MEPYYNLSYGSGMEGILNYSNLLTGGWFVNLFLVFIFIVTTYVLSKSEWRMPGVSAFAFFITLLTAIFFSLFTAVNSIVFYILAAGLGISIAWGYLQER